MNTDETVAKIPGSRLGRIKSASRIFQFLIGFFLLCGIYWLIAFLFHLPFFGQNHVRILVAPGHLYDSPADVPSAIFALWLVKISFGFASTLALFALFQLYARGILFSAKNVMIIRVFGYCTIIDWVIDYQMQGNLHDMSLSMTPLFVGLLIIFIAWVMDEGRKIREEQELTV